jgi:DNA repair photolyase
VGCSIPTDDDRVGKAYEPRAALVSERFETLRTLRRAGIRTIAVVQPLLPMNVERLIDQLAEVCDAIRVDIHRPPALGGAPLVSRDPDVPSPPDQDAVRRELVRAAERRGLPLWTTHVPLCAAHGSTPLPELPLGDDRSVARFGALQRGTRTKAF